MSAKEGAGIWIELEWSLPYYGVGSPVYKERNGPSGLMGCAPSPIQGCLIKWVQYNWITDAKSA